MEGHIDPAERNSSEAALQGQRLWLGFSLLDTFTDNLDQMSFNILERQGLHEGRNIDLLGLQNIEKIG